jgi:hypothetical protein
MEESGPEIVISAFDYDTILPHHAVLIVDEDSNRACALINRILRTVGTKNSKPWEQGTFYTTQPNPKFRFPKKISLYEKKMLPSYTKDVFQQQGFSYPFTSDPSNPGAFPLHFLPQSCLSLNPLTQQMNSKQYLYLNKLLMIPRSFLIFHHCFGKPWPRDDHLSFLLTQHNTHHKLFVVVSCSSTAQLPIEIAGAFDWIFFLERNPLQWKRWHRMAFATFFHTAKIFHHFMTVAKPSQMLVVCNPYQYTEVTSDASALRRRMSVPTVSNEDPVATRHVFMGKQVKLRSGRAPPFAEGVGVIHHPSALY